MSLARVSFAHHDGLPVARVSGEVDAANAARVAHDLLQSLSNETAGLVVDLTPTRYLDSAGINVLFELHEMLQTRRQWLALVADREAPLSRILDLSGVRAAVPTFDDLDAALAAVGRTP